MTDRMIPLTFDVEIPAHLWELFEVLCQAQGHDADKAISNMCQVNMQLILEDILGIEDGAWIEPNEDIYPAAVIALAQYLSMKHQLPLLQAQERAIEYLEGL